MKFLVDAQLPRRLATHLLSLGHDVLHSLDLTDGNCTTDTELNQLSLADQRIPTQFRLAWKARFFAFMIMATVDAYYASRLR